jgi:flagellar biosynthesis/type III secretory pathway M-ring protein FliF/YscJ
VQLPEILAGDELVHATIVVVATDAAGNTREQAIDIYRLKEEEKETGIAKYDSAQWWALVLSIIVLVLALLIVWFLLRSAERRRVLEAEVAGREGEVS